MYNTVQNIKIHLPNFYLLELLIFNSAIRGDILKNNIEKAIEIGDSIWKNLKKNKTKPSNLKEKIEYYFEVGCDYEDKDLFLEYWKYVRGEIAKGEKHITGQLPPLKEVGVCSIPIRESIRLVDKQPLILFLNFHKPSYHYVDCTYYVCMFLVSTVFTFKL